MNLAELASFICEKVGQTDDDSLALCKKFLNRRHQMIWNQHLWRDSIVSGTVSVAANQTSVLAPLDMAQVLTIRENTGDRVLSSQDIEMELMLNPSNIDTATDAVRFSPAGTAVAVAVPAPPTGAGSLGVVSGGTEDSSASVTFALEVLSSSNTSTRVEKRTFQIGDVPQSLANVVAVLSASKTVTNWQFEVAIDGTPYYVMLPEDTEAVRRARVRLSSPCLTAVDLLFVGKREVQPLTDDADVPAMFSMDNALIAMAAGDMLERQRQYSKAQLKFQEGQAHVMALIDREIQQSARNMRVVPDVEASSLRCGGYTKSTF